MISAKTNFMSIGRTFRESIQKAFRSLEVGLKGLHPKKTEYRELDISKIRFPTAFRLLKIKQAFDIGTTIEEIYEQTKIDPWFLYHIKIISDLYKEFNIKDIERLELMKKEEINDRLLTGGGIIPEQDIESLKKIGVGQLFGPGTALQVTIDYVKKWVEQNRPKL